MTLLRWYKSNTKCRYKKINNWIKRRGIRMILETELYKGRLTHSATGSIRNRGNPHYKVTNAVQKCTFKRRKKHAFFFLVKHLDIQSITSEREKSNVVCSCPLRNNWITTATEGTWWSHTSGCWVLVQLVPCCLVVFLRKKCQKSGSPRFYMIQSQKWGAQSVLHSRQHNEPGFTTVPT